MPFRTLFQVWLANAAKAKVRDAAIRAAKEQVAQAVAQPTATDAPTPCEVGFVFALGIESGCLEDRLEGCVTIRGERFTAREGTLARRHAVLLLAGAGGANAARATEVLIDGHRPQIVISAGFAGSLTPQLKRNDILVADCVITADGGRCGIAPPGDAAVASRLAAVRRGVLLTADHVVRSPQEKQSLGSRFGAVAVDMETFAVADVCRRRDVPFLSVRVINDTADETLTSDVEHLLMQKTEAARLGAALGAVWRRPGSAKDMYQLRENALVAADRLASFLANLLRR